MPGNYLKIISQEPEFSYIITLFFLLYAEHMVQGWSRWKDMHAHLICARRISGRICTYRWVLISLLAKTFIFQPTAMTNRLTLRAAASYHCCVITIVFVPHLTFVSHAVFENYNAKVDTSVGKVTLDLWDTAGTIKLISSYFTDRCHKMLNNFLSNW